MSSAYIPKRSTLLPLIGENWKSGITVALISIPLSIALSIASGAGPIPGLVTGIWATLIASIFGGSNYNIIGAAGALTTTLFSATLIAPLGLGALILPVLAMLVGFMILLIWAIGADRFLYYIPSSVMYGFAGGVAFLIAASQLFDATGLSALKRTGTFIGDIGLFFSHRGETDVHTIGIFLIFLAGILFLKKFVKSVPAVIPISVIGIVFGYIETRFLPDIDLITLGDKFGAITGALKASVPWTSIPNIMNPEYLLPLLKISGIIALIAVLETLITAKIGDKITRTQSSSRKELLGLALANIGSGAMGGLPATGVFIRTGANIKAGATHRMSATIAAVVTGVVAVIVLPAFAYLPVAVIAAILMNTALGLIETEKFREFWHQEKTSFFIAILVASVTVLEDAGLGVLAGALLSLLIFADRVSHGRFDVILNFKNGTKEDQRGAKTLHLPHDKEIPVVTYSIAGSLGYIDSARHSANLRHIAHAKNVDHVIIRLRDLFTIDIEGCEVLAEAIKELEHNGKLVYISSANTYVKSQIEKMPEAQGLISAGRFCQKTSEALQKIGHK